MHFKKIHWINCDWTVSRRRWCCWSHICTHWTSRAPQAASGQVWDVNPSDIYNMDETGMNFCTLPNRSLATGPSKGHIIMMAKDWVTAMLYVNGTESLLCYVWTQHKCKTFVPAAGPGEAVETELAALLLEVAGLQLAVKFVIDYPT